jgi:predicted nuclease of restriction endonuclease-like (RecB) superfamily
MDKYYTEFINTIKHKIREAQIKTVVAANSQMLLLYWQLGNYILENQQKEGWGAKIIQLLSKDLKKEFPTMKGFSERNLLYMKQFSQTYSLPVILAFNEIENKLKNSDGISQPLVAQLLLPDNELFIIAQQPVAQIQSFDKQEFTIMQQAVAQIHENDTEALFLQSIVSKIQWSHHIVLIDKEPKLGKRFWYMLNTIEHGISRNILAMQIESKLFDRQIKAKKITNFEKTLPPIHSDFANYVLKDPFIFDFVQAREKADERNIEEQLTHNVTKFLLELGQGFAFIGRQVHFEIGGSDFYADLLFYHTKLHCYVVVELKARSFEPGDASQLNFYVNLINDKLKTESDNNTIGLLLCKGKSEIIAEYALKGYSNPIGVTDYQLSKAIPDELKSSLPQIEDIENEFKDIE